MLRLPALSDTSRPLWVRGRLMWVGNDAQHYLELDSHPQTITKGPQVRRNSLRN